LDPDTYFWIKASPEFIWAFLFVDSDFDKKLIVVSLITISTGTTTRIAYNPGFINFIIAAVMSVTMDPKIRTPFLFHYIFAVVNKDTV
jgi:hypothetical protein